MNRYERREAALISRLEEQTRRADAAEAEKRRIESEAAAIRARYEGREFLLRMWDIRANADRVRIDALSNGLAVAGRWFQEYADGHAAKGDVDKAARNQDRANACRQTIADHPIPAFGGKPSDLLATASLFIRAVYDAAGPRPSSEREEEPVWPVPDLFEVERAALGSGSIFYTLSAIERAEVRSEAINDAARIVEDHGISHGADGGTLRPRIDGDRNGLEYARAIRAMDGV